MDAAVEILNPGLAATIQDSGRWGYQRYGVSVSGAIDQFALHLANVLVGNKSDQAAIEFILLGPKLKFNCPTFIALTGGNCQAYLNQQEIASNRAYQVFPGDILSFDPMKNGRFGYVAFAGGIKTTAVLASRSTTSRIRLGGLNGATLTAGDFLPLSPVYRLNSLKQRYCQLSPLPAKTNLRFIRGPQWDSFSVSAQKKFCQQHFQVSNQADRMGYRLTGVKLPVPTQSMLSEGTVTGSVQVTRSGQPIVLLADRQTAGGYPVIATICAVDLPRLVQLSSQQTFGFTEISISQATELLRQQHAFLHQLQQRFYQQRYQLPLGPQQAAGQRISQLFKH
ncbi:biotin-dependent carboxyltransferase family protein [Liquorilactobacillus nagelii]|uniref:5-oxoprolinase subunit C family protein n=1 Tax=Liquorilactobacillus nagelii TaxID=82688 RepID=UPI0039EB0B8B